MSGNVRWLSAAMLCLAAVACPGGSIIIDHRHTDITQLTSNEIQRAKNVLHIGYGHTSHGSGPSQYGAIVGAWAASSASAAAWSSAVASTG